MTEILHIISDFLANNATMGNLTAILGTILALILSRVNAKLKTEIAKKKEELSHNESDTAKLTVAVLELANMMTIAFVNSKLDAKTKIALQEKQADIFKNLGLDAKEVKKEEVAIKEEEVVKVELKEEKSALDKLKEDLK